MDSSIADEHTKLTFKLAVDHIKNRLEQPGGLTKLAVVEPEDVVRPGNKLTGLGTLNDMITWASLVTAPEGKVLYGVKEYIWDHPDKLDRNLLDNTDAKLAQFLEPRFMSEHIMPGSKGGHPWADAHESFATGWILSGLVSRNHYPEIVARVPEPYRAITGEQLEIMHELRSNLDPDSLTG